MGRSGLYDDLKRQATPARSPDEVALLARLKAIAAKTHHRYGSRRMPKQLQDEGYDVGRFKVRHVMQQAGGSVERRRRRRPKPTERRHGYEVAPHLWERHCDVEAPNVAGCGDITSLWTAEGWLYLSVLVDVYARRVVGLAMRDRVETPLVTDALEMALGRRQPHAGLMHHSDRGSQYASHACRELLAHP